MFVRLLDIYFTGPLSDSESVNIFLKIKRVQANIFIYLNMCIYKLEKQYYYINTYNNLKILR